MTLPWTSHEVDRIIHTYFEMFQKELKGESYQKSTYRRQLLPELNDRSEGSVEYKLQNISAVLVNAEMLYIKGYKPAFNYQGLLEEKVMEYVDAHMLFPALFEEFVLRSPYQSQSKYDFNKMLKLPPIVTEKKNYYSGSRIVKKDYLKIEQQNRTLGENGEELVLNYEKWSLREADKSNLADQVEWISKEQGDGAGFDILSKHENGKDKYIEVKTTRLGALTPIYFSRNEYEVSKKLKSQYHLYRVYNFLEKPEFFVKNGDFDLMCDFRPIQFSGTFK